MTIELRAVVWKRVDRGAVHAFQEMQFGQHS